MRRGKKRGKWKVEKFEGIFQAQGGWKSLCGSPHEKSCALAFGAEKRVRLKKAGALDP